MPRRSCSCRHGGRLAVLTMLGLGRARRRALSPLLHHSKFGHRHCLRGGRGRVSSARVRLAAILMFARGAFGWVALIASAMQLWRPNVVAFGIGLVFALLGLVLYNTRVSALAVALLVLSLARPWPAATVRASSSEQRGEQQRLPIGDPLIERDEHGRAGQHGGGCAISAPPGRDGARLSTKARMARAVTGPSSAAMGKSL